MKIERVEVFPLFYEEPNDGNAAGSTLFVKLVDVSGAVGWGEGWTRFPEATRAAVIIAQEFAGVLCSESAVSVETAFETLRTRSYWYGNGGIASLTLSAFDMAMWDLQGRMSDMSVIDLLGGAKHSSLPILASGHPQGESVSELVDEVGGWGNGSAGVKVGMATGSPANLGFDRDRDFSFVAGVRELLGSSSLLAIDARAATGWSISEATDRARTLAELGVAWLEEPLPHGHLQAYADLRSNVSIPIGHGEKFWTVADYEGLARSGSADIVGIDVARAEGITGSRASIAAIEGVGMRYNSHSWSGVLCEVASVALSFNSASTLVFERKPIRNIIQHDIAINPLRLQGGRVLPPEGPGLGVEMDEKALERLSEKTVTIY